MPEEAKQKKKPGIVRRIFRWIGLGLLALLLIAALIFQAPWKATTPLLILLLACIALPKPARIWFWLSAAAVVIALTIWVFLPDRNDIWRPYTLDKKLTGHEAKFAIPEEQNAATIYNRLLQDFKPKEWWLGFLHQEVYNQTLSETWLSRNHPELTQWLRRHEKTITDLPEACQMKTCRF
ncbi:MAG: hypothetical protein ACYTEO_05060, partial [Planctomycetota bacterium]